MASPLEIEKQQLPEPGNNSAFVLELHRRYRIPLMRYFGKRIRESFDIDDLVQEVFIRLLKQASIHSVQQVESYVFQTAANVIRDRARRQLSHHHHGHDEFSEAAHPHDNLTPDRILLSQEELAVAIDALERLPATTRRVFVLRRYEGMQLDEIAAYLRMSVSGVRFHMAKAKAHLTRSMEQPR
jgi:RNA polymerase sigma-70 factor (ECF subfamily)